MTCLNCGTRHSAKYCPECGAVAEAITACPMCGYPHTNKFCPECGTAAATLPAQAPQPAMPQEAQTEYFHQYPPQEAAMPGPVYTAMAPAQPVQPAAPMQQGFPAAQPPAAPAPVSLAQASSAQVTPTIIINNSNENHATPVPAGNGAYPYTQPYTPGVQFTASYKSKLTALLLCIFMGYFGIHYFYVGKVFKGLVYLFTGGLFGLGWLIDIARIAVGSFRDSWGYPLVV